MEIKEKENAAMWPDLQGNAPKRERGKTWESKSERFKRNKV